jgi:chromosomal replication initiation ATPase DnaA
MQENWNNITPHELSDIVYHVAQSHKMNEAMIINSTNTLKVVAVRHLAVYLCCMRGYTLNEVAKYFKYRNHSGVIHARNRVDNELQTNQRVMTNTLNTYKRYYKRFKALCNEKD